jgi:DNA-binding MarR family transcriptional regulator
MESNNRLIYLLSMAQVTLRAYVNEALTKGGVKVTIAQCGILFLLEQKDLRTMSELGAAIHVDNSAMTRLIDRLERNGSVERRIDPGNRRAILIHITPQGMEEEKKAGEIVEKINREIANSFSPEEIEAYKKVLKGILANFKTRQTSGL